MAEVMLAELSDRALDVGAHLDAVRTSAVGAVASFVGTVRDHSPDAAGEVVELEYSAHPDAAGALAEIAERVAMEFEGVRLAVSHRVGVLAVGDVAIVVAAADAHRGEAFDACRALVEAVKAELPVWKKQVLADGSHTWVGSA
ncbi:molybdenum cofactor biosynthesis protein MoaE [Pseudactinotalea sp.]|uniref:molybdenum cofactor biosynthesis protein MoaE n=1 Tax=Pseudactinotalea sp. TaxID=1926260 RepID=UPI003B3A54EF